MLNSSVLTFINRDSILKHGLPPVDHHLHSRYSDGLGEPQDYVEAAIRHGITEIALTEHVWTTSTWIPEFAAKIRELRINSGFRILAGVEAKAINLAGDVDLDDQNRHHLDLVMGVVHRYPTDAIYEFSDHSTLSPEEAALRETETIENMIRRGTAQVIGHPTRTFYKYYGNRTPFPREYLERIVLSAKKHRVPIELTGAWCPDDSLLRLGLQENVFISLGSDSHSPEGVGRTNGQRYLSVLKEI